MRFKNPFRFCLWSNCLQAKKRRLTSFGFNSYGTQFPYFWIILVASKRFKVACWVLPMIMPILLAFGTSLQQIMLSIRNLRKFSLFHRHAGPRNQNYRFWSVETTHDTFFHQEQPHRKYLRAFDEPQPQFSSNESRKSKLTANDENSARKLTYLMENKFMMQTKIH